MKFRNWCAVLALAACAVARGEAEEAAWPQSYAGASGALVLPQGGSRLRRLGGAAARLGRYVTENVALEVELGSFEDRAGLAARAVCHWRGWEEYDRLFGYSQFDPFFTLGARGWIDRAGVGPEAGVGALYYLTDAWALRTEAGATLALDAGAEVVFAVSCGVQFSF